MQVYQWLWCFYHHTIIYHDSTQCKNSTLIVHHVTCSVSVMCTMLHPTCKIKMYSHNRWWSIHTYRNIIINFINRSKMHIKFVSEVKAEYKITAWQRIISGEKHYLSRHITFVQKNVWMKLYKTTYYWKTWFKSII